MLQKLRQARLLVPTLVALAALAVLVSLGNWQIARKHWKDGLVAKIAARVHADPVPLPALEPSGAGTPDLEYLHVTVKGRFHHDKERYLYAPAPAPAGLGWHVYTPLELPSQRFVWVNRGFVPDANKAPSTRPDGQVAGQVEVRGLVRLPPDKPGLFAAENDPAHNLWYWPDLAAMTASAFPRASQETAEVLPVAIEADAEPAPPGGLPRGGVTRLTLPDRHLEYAVTWYGLAATLVGVYLAFAISRLRSAPSPL